jgi:hypothetical protein
MGKFKFGNPQKVVKTREKQQRVIEVLPNIETQQIVAKMVPQIEYIEVSVDKIVEKIVEKPVYITSYVEREKLMKDKRLRQVLLGSRKELRSFKKDICSSLSHINSQLDVLSTRVPEKVVEVHKIQEISKMDYKILFLVLSSLALNVYVLMFK